MKKNKRTSKVTKLATSTPVINAKPFTNLLKPSFKSFEQLYQLIETRLGKERNENARLINWILTENDLNDEQLIGFLLLEMLFFEKRLKTVDRQKMVKSALHCGDYIAKEIQSERDIFSLLSEKQLAETLLVDEQLFQLVLADQLLIEQICKMTFDYIPINPLLKKSINRAMPAELRKEPPTKTVDEKLNIIKTFLEEVGNWLDEPEYSYNLRGALALPTEIESVVLQMRIDIQSIADISLHEKIAYFLDQLRALILNLEHLRNHSYLNYTVLEEVRRRVKILEEMCSQVRVYLHDNKRKAY